MDKNERFRLVVADWIATFRKHQALCEEAEHTDVGMLWELIHNMIIDLESEAKKCK